MPKISVTLSSGSDDRYAIPNTIQKQQIHEEEERRELRITDSLMDDSDSDSSGGGSDDGNAKTRGYNNDQSSKISSHHMNDITNCNLTKEDSNNCQTPLLQHYNLTINDTCDKSTAIRNNTTVVNNNTSNKTNLLDKEIANDTFAAQTNEDLLHHDDDSLENDVFKKRTNRRHSSDTFMSVYEDLATKSRRTASLGSSSQPIKVAQNNNSTSRYSNNNTATGRRKQVKTLVTTALQTVAEGLVVSHNSCDGIGTWDVVSGNKRMSIENSSNYNQRRKSRRKSLNIRAELTLQEEECASLRQKLETSQAEIEALQRDKSITVQSNAILESKLKHSQSEVEKLRRDLKTERQQREKVQSDNDQTTRHEKGKLKSRLELQNEIDTMRTALDEIKQVESDRLKRTKCMETELHEAKSMISSLKEENESLRAATQSEMMNDKKTSFDKKVEWTESCGEGMEGIEVLTNDDKTLKNTDLDAINSLGAEDVDELELADHVSKIPLKAVCQMPDSSSKQLSFIRPTEALTPTRMTKVKGKPKNQASGECSLCFRQPKTNGLVKYCQCGKASCNKWAHRTCLLNRKSVSSVSHPGSPMPSLPTILCDGIYCKEI